MNLRYCFLLILLLVMFLCGCTINFKASELELDSKPIEGKIGTGNITNRTYELVSADIFKNANH